MVRQRLGRTAFGTVALVAICTSVGSAATLYWDPAPSIGGTGSGGTGTWNTTAANKIWADGTNPSSSDVAWVNASNNDAVFGNTGGTVTVSAVTAKSLSFTANNYILSSSTVTLAGGTGIIDVSGSNVTTINSGIAGSTGLTKNGTGTLILGSSAKSYTGGTIVNNGILKQGVANFNTGALTVNSGGTFDLGGFAVAPSSVGAGTGTITNSGSSAATLTIKNANGTTVGTLIDNAGVTNVGTAGYINLTLTSGSGTAQVTLAGNNTFRGDVTITNGRFALSNNSNLGDAANVINTTLLPYASGGLIGTATYTDTHAINLATGTALPFQAATGQTFTLGGKISGAGILQAGISGSMLGTVKLTGNNDYTGKTLILGTATLSIDADTRLGTAPGSVVANAIQFGGDTNDNGSGSAQSPGILQVTDTFTLNANRGITIATKSGSAAITGTIDVAATKTLTYNGTIAAFGQAANNFTKTGDGTLKFGGTGTYGGTTTVTAGTFLVNGTLDNQATGVSLGNTVAIATLGGNGSIYRPVSILQGTGVGSNVGAHLSPGSDGTADVGTLTIGDGITARSLTLRASATASKRTAYDLTIGTGGTADRVTVNGDLLMQDTSSSIDLNLFSLLGADPTGQTYTILSWTGADPANRPTFVINYGATGFTGGTVTYVNATDSLAGGSIVLSGLIGVPVPEPATIGLCAGGLAMILYRRRHA